MKKTTWSFIAVLLFCLISLAAISAQEPKNDLKGDHDFAVGISPRNFVLTSICSEIGGSEEWKTFYSALTAKMDFGYEMVKHVPGFPTELDSWLQGVLGGALKKSKVGAADLIDGVFDNVEAMFLQGDLEFREEKVDLSHDAVLSVVIRFDPSMFSGITQFIKKDEHYKLVKESDKMTLIASMDDKLVVGIARWKNSGYYLIVAGNKSTNVEKQIDSLQNLEPKQTLSQFVTTSVFIDLSPTPQTRERFNVWSKNLAGMEKSKKVMDDLAGFSMLYNNIASIQIRLSEVDGVTTLTKTVDANSDEAASQIKAISEGGVALLRFLLSGRELKPEEKMVAPCLKQIRVEGGGKTVKASCLLGNEANDFIRFVLKKATEELKKN